MPEGVERLALVEVRLSLSRHFGVLPGRMLVTVSLSCLSSQLRRLSGKQVTPRFSPAHASDSSPLGRLLAAETDRAGRILVRPDLRVPGNDNIFVIGDMAFLKDTKGRIVPGLGSSAMQMGKATSKNILRLIRSEATVPFTYVDKGSMATIGRNKAIAEIGKIHLSGLIAWLAWSLVHVMLMVGFKNKILVLFEWIWSYISGQGSVRLITGNNKPK